MAMAILLLIYEGNVAHADQLSDFLFFGELGLDGSLRRVDGLLPSVLSAVQHGYKDFFVPEENRYELEYIPAIRIFPLTHFSQIVDYFVHGQDIPMISQSKSVEDLYDRV
jgi:magnesium chelatase family protein